MELGCGIGIWDRDVESGHGIRTWDRDVGSGHWIGAFNRSIVRRPESRVCSHGYCAMKNKKRPRGRAIPSLRTGLICFSCLPGRECISGSVPASRPFVLFHEHRLLFYLCQDFIFAVLHCCQGLLQQLVQVPAQHLRSPGNDFARAARREGLALVFLLERFQFHVLCAL